MIKKYITILILLSVFVCSDNLKDLAKTYIEHGKEGVISNINKLAQSKSFWNNYIKDIDTTYGYLGYKDHMILSSKKKKTIDIFKIENKNPKLHKSLNAIFGSIDGDKQIEGDKKTPIGIYDFIARLDRGKSRLADKYGPLALVTTYPNLMDKLIHKKTGHGIWLHGKPYDTNNKIDTLGCVAINNDELAKLGKILNYKKTILVISKDEHTTASKDEISTLLANLYTWKHQWQNNNFQEYISYYSPEFRRFDNTNLENFVKYKQAIFAKNQEKSITFTQINIIPYTQDNKEKIFKISFFETYKSNTFRFKGQKNLYTKLVDNKMVILVEE